MVTRSISEKRLAKIIEQVKFELDEAKTNLDATKAAYELAQNHFQEVENDYNSLTNESTVEELPPQDSDLTPPISKPIQDSTNSENTLPTQRIRFWEEPGFNWRKFIPAHIKDTDMPFSNADFIELAQMDAQEKEKYDSTISSALWELTKPEVNVLIGFQFPGVRGAFYGSVSFFEGRNPDNPKLGTLKPEYLEKLSARIDRPVPVIM